MIRRPFSSRFALVAALALATAACGDDPFQVEFQVIEEVEFAASLGIDLSTMTRIGTGVYIKDIVVGEGDQVVFGSTPTITYTGWLADGTEFDSGSYTFLMGNNRVISGLEDGMLNQRVGGTRLMIIPPNRGYGGQHQYDVDGSVLVPAGSVLIFEVTVDAVQG